MKLFLNRIVGFCMAVVMIGTSGCVAHQMRVTTAMQVEYAEALNNGVSPVQKKEGGLGMLMSVVPGLGIYYSSDSLGDAVGYCVSSLLIVPYVLSFIDSTKICDYQNMNGTIELYKARIKTGSISTQQQGGALEQLQKLSELHQQGVISSDEYNKMKSSIIKTINR